MRFHVETTLQGNQQLDYELAQYLIESFARPTYEQKSPYLLNIQQRQNAWPCCFHQHGPS